MMDANFWRQKWLEGDIGFHQSQVEPALVAYLAACKLPAKARIFLPLCGKTLDMLWLQQQGYQVVGAELSELAVEQFFQSLGVVPDITEYPRHRHYRSTDIEIWLGDLFELDQAMLGQVDAVYDRAALVALPADMRTRYAQQVSAITAQAPQLLLSFVYEQQLYAGPPFAVTADEIQQLYAEHYRLHLLAEQSGARLKNQTPVTTQCWLLQPKSRNTDNISEASE
jgi:thiopurine S-methyltransferase